MTESATTDYVVAGAGPAGLTIARLLALRGRSVTVVDDERRNVSRLELLAPAAQRTVAVLGLDPLLHDKAIAKPCLGIRRPHEKNEYEDFLQYSDRVGYIVDRPRFDECLRGAALGAGAEILPLRVSGVARDSGMLRVTNKAGAQGLLAVNGIVIDATGRAAAIARRKGAEIAFRDRMVAELVEDTSIVPALPEDDDAPSWLHYQRDAFSWSYRVQGPSGRVQTWRVRRRSGARFNTMVRGVDASACILSRAAGNRWIAVGDAAMSFDPIASQGLFNALASALAAAGLLLSQEGLSAETANAWSGAVAATFMRSEAGRANLAGVSSPGQANHLRSELVANAARRAHRMEDAEWRSIE